MSAPATTACPCGQCDARGQTLQFTACCGRYLDHDDTPAPDAERLMRSRYSAFVLGRTDYLRASWHPSTCPTDLTLEPGAKWLGLAVKAHRAIDADHAEVEFVARSRVAGRGQRLHERSRFVLDPERGKPRTSGRGQERLTPAASLLMRQRSMSLRSAASPAASTFAHCAAVSRMERCSKFSPGNFSGLPMRFLGVSMWQLSVMQKNLQSPYFCDSIEFVKTLKTLKLRIKDKHARVLGQMAREVNQVFNFCNETSSRAIRERCKWLSGYDLQKLTAGFSKCEGVTVGSGTVQLVCAEYATRRKQFKKQRLNWRLSNPKSSRYSLGWVPFKGGHAKYKAGQIEFAGKKFSLWDSYGLSQFELRAGSFSQDARGRWYFNVVVEVDAKPSAGTAAVGIDLGLKECATTSTGDKIEGRWYRANEKALATAQRAGKKQCVRAIHAKIRNQRKDALHKFSTALVQNNAAIFAGDVASAKLVKTKMAKSTLDAGWSMLKTMLEYKATQAGIVFEEVNESYSTQTCSSCGSIPSSSPKGLAGLNKRDWACCECGAVHNRDVNAALNIRARGLSRLEEGTPA